MAYLFLDFAERHSAGVLLDVHGEVVGEAIADFGPLSRPPTTEQILDQLAAVRKWVGPYGTLAPLLHHAVHVVVEDVNPFAINPKPAVRAQGALLPALFSADTEAGGLEWDHIHLVNASVWQKYHGYKKKKGVTSKGWAKQKCAELGYVPGQLLEGGSTGKATVDLRDAYLGARWFKETY